uniref:G-protein coupled receptors family 3 profile domain-containing protein n=1 Tax=Xenopus tropicalis TaxID=8364 RepID=A0A6I8S2F4_XENTR
MCWLILSTVCILCTVSIEVCAIPGSEMGCNLTIERTRDYLSQPGDIIIGGTFPIYWNRVYKDLNFTTKPPELHCERVAPQYYETMQALIFAVEEINAQPKLLPNITLGFQVFDTCFNLRKAAHGTLSMLSGGKETTPNYHCNKLSPLASIIGDSGSSVSIIMAQMLGLNRYPQISYFATSPILNNRYLFPSFFRTIPSDEFQMKGLAQLVSHFGWSWVGLLAPDNDYGQFGLQMIKQEIINNKGCVAFAENILTGQPNRNAPRIVQLIRASTATVVVVLDAESSFVIVLEELLRQNVTGIIWVAGESWATSAVHSESRFERVAVGTLGFAIHGAQLPMFSQYLNSLSPSKMLFDPFIKEYWEQSFSCKWLSQENLATLIENGTIQACTGKENLGNTSVEPYHRLTLNVYNAVYAIAWALQNLILCVPGNGPFDHGSCTNISSFQPWHLLRYIKNVTFQTTYDSQVFFDAKGNPPAIYDIVNWHVSNKGNLEQVTVGRYDLNAPDGKVFKIDITGIIWPNNNTQAPLSNCSPSCPPGFRKVMVTGKPPCCYECALYAAECHSCSWNKWPNLQRDKCLQRTTEFLSYKEPLGYGLSAISIFSSLIPLVILFVFNYYKTTPVVRANNYSLSCLLLLSLFLCFLCSLGFIGYPQPAQCLLRQVAFGIVFSLCISCVLAKTITVIIAFNATKPGSRLRQWAGVRVSYCVIVLCTFTQLVICVIWLFFFPPFPELDNDTQPGIIIANCNEGSPTAFWCMLGYLGFLASISFIVAFMARRLPDSFNEAKFITFSMLAFLSVWVSFIPAYLSARGMYTVAMEVFAILSSSWTVMLCIFVPKCFIILFRPNMNSREHLMGKVRGQK